MNQITEQINGTKRGLQMHPKLLLDVIKHTQNSNCS